MSILLGSIRWKLSRKVKWALKFGLDISSELLLCDVKVCSFLIFTWLYFLTLRWQVFTLIHYDPSQVIEMLTIVANLVTKFECVVFWLLSPYPLLHSTSLLRYFNAIGKHLLMIMLNSNLLSKHGVEHDSLLQCTSFLMSCSCSRKHV